MSFTGTIANVKMDRLVMTMLLGKLKGAIMRGASASTTTVGVGIVNSLYHTSGASAWDVALSADIHLLVNTSKQALHLQI